jgi:hypothetical protein
MKMLMPGTPQASDESGVAASTQVDRLRPLVRSAGDSGPTDAVVSVGGFEGQRPAPAIRVEIPIRTISEMNGRGHWASKAKRAKLHRQAAWLCLAAKVRPCLPCIVTLTRIAPRALDGDNLQASLKACRDGVADWIGVDDRDPRVSWCYQQHRGAPKQYSVEVAVEHE